MAFWNKDKKENELPKYASVGRNDPCHCGSGKKYKKCCMAKDETVEHKAIEENWAKSAEQAKEQAEKNAKEAPATPAKHAGKQPTTQQKHQKFIPTQVSTPRKSGGG